MECLHRLLSSSQGCLLLQSPERKPMRRPSESRSHLSASVHSQRLNCPPLFSVVVGRSDHQSLALLPQFVVSNRAVKMSFTILITFLSVLTGTAGALIYFAALTHTILDLQQAQCLKELASSFRREDGLPNIRAGKWTQYYR